MAQPPHPPAPREGEGEEEGGETMHNQYGIGDTIVLVCHVILQDHVFKGSRVFKGSSPQGKLSSCQV